jgi:hypothetical protein
MRGRADLAGSAVLVSGAIFPSMTAGRLPGSGVGTAWTVTPCLFG